MAQHETTKLRKGDIFYTEYDGQFHIYKLLRKEEAAETFHVLGYKSLAEEPTLDKLNELEINFFHAPIHQESFSDTTFLINIPVTDEELIGFFEYQKQMDAHFDTIIAKATEYYQKGYNLTDEGKLEAAIAAYTKAIELLPTFYEAFDNRAFCKMDLGRWNEAMEDFRLSLQINPDSLLAEFSIGECYFRLGQYVRAKEQFEKCVKLDPSHKVSQDFLLKTIDIINSSISK